MRYVHIRQSLNSSIDRLYKASEKHHLPSYIPQLVGGTSDTVVM